MSYILDALRRADSERERGAVPGLHTQSMRADAADLRAKPWWGQPWAWVGAGLFGGLVVAFVARWLFADPVVQPTASVAMSNTAPAPAPTPAPAPSPPPSTQAPVMVPTPPTSAPPAIAPLAPARPAVAAVPPAPAPAPAAPIYNAPPIEARKPAVTASAPAPQADTRTYALNELPDEVRRQLPNLSIGGSSYSENPANRLLILNGQVFREGDKITAELALEQIQLKSAVLRFKGYRYRVSY